MQIVTALIPCKGLYCLRHVPLYTVSGMPVPGTFKNGCSKLDVHIELSPSSRFKGTHSRMRSLPV